eukprot:gb/GECG01015863.1/.p1 GENE.gb/GECG01015863.1/~~gb/GECG01015863.1/.p1  ORF type:complete len:157 (+),score=9.17 gb/GECG01015863.1/:1-471(+)
MELTQNNVCLSGDILKHEIIGAKSPSAQKHADRSKHKILINGIEAKDCGHVTHGEIKSCEADISSYHGKHNVTLTWVQRAGDNLGTSAKANVRILDSSSRCSWCPFGVKVFPRTCNSCCCRSRGCSECISSIKVPVSSCRGSKIVRKQRSPISLGK